MRYFIFCILFPAPITTNAHPGASSRLDLLQHEIDRHPADGKLYSRRGFLYLEKSQPEKAVHDFNTALTLGDKENAQYGLGEHYRQQNNCSQAIIHYTRSIAITPHRQALHGRAQCYVRLNNPVDAIKDYTQLTQQISELQQEYYFELAKLQAKTPQFGPHVAIATLNEGITSLGPLVHFHRFAIELHKELRQFEQVKSRLNSIKPWMGNTAEWQYEMGSVLLDLEKPNEAKPYLISALEQIQKRKGGVHQQKIIELEKQIILSLSQL